MKTRPEKVPAENWASVACLNTVFILMYMLTKMNGHKGVIFIIIDHDNDNTVKDGSDRLVQSQ